MQEPSEGIEYVTRVSESGLCVEIEAFQNGDRITYVEIARSAWPAVVQAVAESTMQDVEDRLIAETRRANSAEIRMRNAEARLDEAQQVIEHWQDRALHAERKLPAYPDDWGKPGAALKQTPSERGLCSTCMHSRHLDHDCPRCPCPMNSGER